MITIYYGTFLNQLELAEPVNIVSNYTKTHEEMFTRCPAWLNINKNLFGIKSSQKFTMSVKDGNFQSNESQEWFNNNILVRDKNSFSFEMGVVFFTLENSLILEQRTPVLENNDIKNKTTLVEGMFDIGKWVRSLECSVVMNKDDTINITEDDIIYYIKFHTKEKIRFKKFLITDRLANLLSIPAQTRKNRKKASFKPLEYFYKLMNAKRYKKILFNEIKKNLI